MNLDPTILSSVIIAIGAVVAAVLAPTWASRVARRRDRASKPVPNFLHAQRDYTKTQARLEKMLNACAKSGRKPDLYLTNFGTPIAALEGCKGYRSYHAYLAELVRSRRCVLHMYLTLTGELQLDDLLKRIVSDYEGHVDANVYSCASPSFGALGGFIINFLALTGKFAAVTFEDESKVLLSLHTTEPEEVAAVIDVIRSVQPDCDSVLLRGKDMKRLNP